VLNFLLVLVSFSPNALLAVNEKGGVIGIGMLVCWWLCWCKAIFKAVLLLFLILFYTLLMVTMIYRIHSKIHVNVNHVTLL